MQLQTAFGGGKTHTMLAVLHLATRKCALADLAGIPALIDWVKTNQPDALKQVALPKNFDAVKGQVSLGLVATIVTDKKTNQPRTMDYVINGTLQDLETSEPIEGQTHLVGRIKDVDADTVLFESERGRLYRVPLSSIARARLEVEF